MGSGPRFAPFGSAVSAVAAAVATDEPDLLTGVDAQAGAGEHFLGAEVLLYVFEGQQAHEDRRA